MGGVDIGAGAGGSRRRSVDSEINMIPMIDLLMVTISFLLITAVWSRSSRMAADAQVPGRDVGTTPADDSPVLHVDVRKVGAVTLTWKRSGSVLSVKEVEAPPVVTPEAGATVVRYPGLAREVRASWEQEGAHRPLADKRAERAVLHTGNEVSYASILGVLDALAEVDRPRNAGGKEARAQVFNVVFATD